MDQLETLHQRIIRIFERHSSLWGHSAYTERGLSFYIPDETADSGVRGIELYQRSTEKYPFVVRGLSKDEQLHERTIITPALDAATLKNIDSIISTIENDGMRATGWESLR